MRRVVVWVICHKVERHMQLYLNLSFSSSSSSEFFLHYPFNQHFVTHNVVSSLFSPLLFLFSFLLSFSVALLSSPLANQPFLWSSLLISTPPLFSTSLPAPLIYSPLSTSSTLASSHLFCAPVLSSSLVSSPLTTPVPNSHLLLFSFAPLFFYYLVSSSWFSSGPISLSLCLMVMLIPLLHSLATQCKETLFVPPAFVILVDAYRIQNWTCVSSSTKYLVEICPQLQLTWTFLARFLWKKHSEIPHIHYWW